MKSGMFLALVLILGATVSSGIAARPGSAPASQGPSPEEQKALDQLVAEIQGAVVYTRFKPAAATGKSGSAMRPDFENEIGNWVVEKVVLGDWKPAELGEGRFVKWSFDGSKLAVYVPKAMEEEGRNNCSLGEIVVMNADGSGRKTVADDATEFNGNCNLTFHPNNKEIVYFRKGWAEIGTVNIETGAKGVVKLPGKGYDCEPSFSADGKWFVARKQRAHKSLEVVDLENQKERAYGTGCCASISPDGLWMTNNFDGHNRMTIHNRLDENKNIYATTETLLPERKWDNPTWSNHNNYFVAKGDRGEWNAFLFKVSEQRWTRVTWGRQTDYPSLYITKDLKTGKRPSPADPIPVQPE